MNLIGTKPLETERLLLRRYTMDDAEAMFTNWCSDDEVTRHLTWPTHPDVEVTRTVLSTWVEGYADDGRFQWGIEKDGELIGDIAVVAASTQHEFAEIGYCVGRAWWGQGIMSEALGAVMRFLFEEVGVHRIVLRHDTLNPASGKVMLKNGLRPEGTQRGHFKRNDGTYADLAFYGILRDEWEENHARP